jgi:hypothetical protein
MINLKQKREIDQKFFSKLEQLLLQFENVEQGIEDEFLCEDLMPKFIDLKHNNFIRFEGNFIESLKKDFKALIFV